MRLYENEPKTILLVEDSPDDERLAVRAIKQLDMPIVLDVVRDGAEALDYFFGENGIVASGAVTQPMLILLDLKLPKVSGIEVLRKLSANPMTRCIPVVILTLSDEERDLVDCYSLGANSYIRKPVNYDHFIEIIHQLCTYWFTIHHHIHSSAVSAERMS
jgi:two-component system response regulator